MRRWIVAAVIVSQVLVSVPVYAQAAPQGVLDAIRANQSPYGCIIPRDGISKAQWNSYTQAQRDACPEGFDPSGSQMSHPILGLVGILTAAAGIGVATHTGEDTYHVLGDAYCVGNYRVDYGSCGGPTQTQIGLAMIGGGVLMTWLGLRSKHVSVAPSLSPTRKAVTAHIQW